MSYLQQPAKPWAFRDPSPIHNRCCLVTTFTVCACTLLAACVARWRVRTCTFTWTLRRNYGIYILVEQ